MRKRPGVVIVATAVVVVVVAVNLWLFLWPRSSSAPATADAVAVLSGGAGDRLPKATALMAKGVAPTLVIPNGHDPKWVAANRLCDRPQPFKVVCPDPHPNTTRGEAELIGVLAAQSGWHQLVVVTSSYHVTRARILLKRCLHGPVFVVASTPDSGVLSWPGHVVHEWGGLAAALARREC